MANQKLSEKRLRCSKAQLNLFISAKITKNQRKVWLPHTRVPRKLNIAPVNYFQLIGLLTEPLAEHSDNPSIEELRRSKSLLLMS